MHIVFSYLANKQNKNMPLKQAQTRERKGKLEVLDLILLLVLVVHKPAQTLRLYLYLECQHLLPNRPIKLDLLNYVMLFSQS